MMDEETIRDRQMMLSNKLEFEKMVLKKKFDEIVPVSSYKSTQHAEQLKMRLLELDLILSIEGEPRYSVKDLEKIFEGFDTLEFRWDGDGHTDQIIQFIELLKDPKKVKEILNEQSKKNARNADRN